MAATPRRKTTKKRTTTAARKSAKSAKNANRANRAKKRAPTKNPAGGLTAAGRRKLAREEGAHLRPGVKGPADTPEKMRRKGSFLRRHFASPRGPMVDDKGQPTRLALSAHAWGEPVPRTMAAAKKLAAKGARLLERYATTKARPAGAKTAKKGAKKSAKKGAKRRAAKPKGAKRAARQARP